MKKLSLGLLLAFMPACDDSEELTCEVLAAPDFCWTVAVREAYACTNAGTFGEISTDGKTCEIDAATTATFTPALEPSFDIQEFTIVVSNAEGECAKLVDDHDSKISLKTKSGSVYVHVDPNDYTIECPDGTTFATDKPLDLLTCGGGIADNARLPGTIKSSGSFSITPRPAGSTSFVSCAFPAATP